MKKLYFLFASFLLLIPIYARTAFPHWYSPVRAKVDGFYIFYRHMKKNTKDYYRANVIKYKKRTFENGSEIIEIEIKFSIPGCQKVARVTFLDKDCNEKQCYPLPIEIGECISNP